MKRLSPISTQQRIVLYFILIIVLPSVMMGGLAFRGVINDQALIERDNRRRVKEGGLQIIEYTENTLLELEEEFEAAIIQHSGVDEILFSDAVLDTFILLHPLVENIFYIEEDEVKMLKSALQYFPDQHPKLSAPYSHQVNTALERGWKYEYQDRDYPRALSFYRDVIPQLQDAYSKATALNAIARIQKKAAALEAAVKSYEKLTHEYGDYRLNQSLPLGLVADIELFKLFIELGHIPDGLKMQIRLQENLINNKWELDEATYQLFSSKAEALLDKHTPLLKAHSPKLFIHLDSLVEKRQALQLKTRDMLFLRQRMKQSVLPARERRVEELGSTSYLISILPDGSTNNHWCLLISTDRLLKQFITPLLHKASAQGRWYWSILNRRGVVLMQSSEPAEQLDYVEMNFPAQLPRWTLSASSKPFSLFQTFISSGQGIYLYLFFFISSVLMAGLVFTLYSINRELQLTRMKSDFITSVSHEFRTPLTAIRQTAEMLENDRVPAERKKVYHSLLLQQGGRLIQLIDNILDFNRIEQGKKSYRFEEANVAALIEHTIERYQNRVQVNGFQINSNIQAGLPRIRIDQGAFSQVLHNLLDNAIKYSGSSQAIELHAEMDQDNLRISVRDYGIGIPKEEQNRIFERFYRVPNKQEAGIQGSGIGLALAREIMEAHRGKMRVESIPGEGSTFYLYLPANLM